MTEHETKVQVFMSFFIDIATESHPEDINDETMREIVAENAVVYLDGLKDGDIESLIDSYDFYRVDTFVLNDKETDTENEEIVINLPNGNTLHSSSEEYMAGDYVKICDKNGKEIAYWDKQEWADNPVEVMGAIIRAAAGEK